MAVVVYMAAEMTYSVGHDDVFSVKKLVVGEYLIEGFLRNLYARCFVLNDYSWTKIVLV